MKIINKQKYLLSFVLLVIISFTEFAIYVNKEYFFRFKYDLSNTQTIKNHGEIDVYESNHSTIYIKNKKDLILKEKAYYSLTFLDEGREYFFSFDNLSISDTIILNYVVWRFKNPITKNGKAVLKEVLLKRIEKGEVDITMLTEQLGCCLMNGKKMRYHWNKINRDLNFKGNKTDVFGYHYFGGENLKTAGLLKESRLINDVDYTIIWTGRNEGNISTEESINNITAMIAEVKKNNINSKIVLLFPVPSPVESYDKKISEMVQAVRNHNWDDVIKIDLYSFVKEQNDWQNIMFYENYALTEQAYSLIVKYINERVFTN